MIHRFVLPDRAQVTMDKSFLAAYVSLLIKTCHKRGAHAIGGMAAQIPVKNDEEANRIAFEKVRLDKLREVNAGHDGTWVAHPGLVPVAKKVFDEYMPQPNQLLSKKQFDAIIGQKELLGRAKRKHDSCRIEYEHQRGLAVSRSLVGRQGCRSN